MTIARTDKSCEVTNKDTYRLSGPGAKDIDEGSFVVGFLTALILATDNVPEFHLAFNLVESYPAVAATAQDALLAMQDKEKVTVTNADGSPLWEGYEAPWELDNSGK